MQIKNNEILFGGGYSLTNSWLYNTDLNDTKIPGFYVVGQNNTNTPITTGAENWCNMIVCGTGTDIVSQIFIDHNGEIFTRAFFNGAWGSWQ